MPEVIGKTATEVMKKSIDLVLKKGEVRDVWGGTIPQNISDQSSPNDFSRTMVELPYPAVFTLKDPLSRWTDYSRHSIGITLRETEDHLQGYNPGLVIKHSNLYRCWLDKGYFNYTYGERICHYPYSLTEISGKCRHIGWEYNQIKKAIRLLKENPSSRKVCISTWYPPNDLGNNYCPCNMVFQLRVVENKLEWNTVVRSLDVLRGLSENIFMFTIWQEYVAKALNVDLGNYNTVVLNAHIYQDQIDSGYHNQKIIDQYDYIKPTCAFDNEFPSEVMSSIDSILYKTSSTSRYNEIKEKLSTLTPYWRNWKTSLVGDWYRRNDHHIIASDCVSSIDNEFALPLARYIYKKYPDVIDEIENLNMKKFILDNSG